jgi:hypothetical protein
MTKARDIASATPAPSTVSATELGYLDGVSSAIQTQIDGKIGSASAINPTIVDAKGDLLVGSAADTVARLAVGTNNHVLTADSAATNGIKWAAVATGGMTELGTTTLSGTSYTFSAIPQSGYRQLYLEITGPNAASAFDLNVELQQTDGTGGNEQYCIGHYYISGGSYTTFTNGNTKEKIRLTYPGSSRATYSYLSNHAITFYNYWNQRATYIVSSGYQNDSSNRIVFTQMGASELSNIYNIKINSSQTLTGGTATLWGVK